MDTHVIGLRYRSTVEPNKLHGLPKAGQPIFDGHPASNFRLRRKKSPGTQKKSAARDRVAMGIAGRERQSGTDQGRRIGTPSATHLLASQRSENAAYGVTYTTGPGGARHSGNSVRLKPSRWR